MKPRAHSSASMPSEYFTDDLRIHIKEVAPPRQIQNEIPLSRKATFITLQARREIYRILTRQDDRLLAVIGPCPIHDPAALECVSRLLEVKEPLCSVVMLMEFLMTCLAWRSSIKPPTGKPRQSAGSTCRLNTAQKPAAKRIGDRHAAVFRETAHHRGWKRTGSNVLPLPAPSAVPPTPQHRLLTKFFRVSLFR